MSNTTKKASTIPKVIHYCWFGGSKKPDDVLACIESWRKVMPDYEIIEWNENNYDLGKNCYIKQAYEKKKWAFVTDYVRLDVCNSYGGIYMDTDVEVIKSFDDLLHLESFCGREHNKRNSSLYPVGTGLVFASRAGSKIVKELLEDYRERKFVMGDGSLDLTPCPEIQTNTLKKKGLYDDNVKQEIDGLTIFPTEYFCPMNQYTGTINITRNTYSIHHYSASWLDDADKERRRLRMEYGKRYGRLLSNILSAFVAYRRHYGLVKGAARICKKVLKG